MAQWVKNLISIHEIVGLIPGLPQRVKESGIATSCGVDHRCGLDLALQWLWCRSAATAPICPLGWELPYASGVTPSPPATPPKKD